MATPDCSPAKENSPDFFRGFDVVESFEQAENVFQRFYKGVERIRGRVYKSKENQYVFSFKNKNTVIPQIFIESLKMHISAAIEKKYVRHVMYSDMGHVHLLVPNDYVLTDWTQLMSDSKLLFLYHTAELYIPYKGVNLLGHIDVEKVWYLEQYLNRNFVGEMNNKEIKVYVQPGTKYNTVRTIENYKQIKTVYFSASQSGCFEYTVGSTPIYFDISFF